MGSNFKISVSCHHFGWAFPSSAKRWGNEGRRIPFKTRFFNFPHRGEAKKQPWDGILQFQFHATILGGLFQAAEKAGLTKVVQLRSKRVFSTFPILARQKKQPWDQILQLRFHATILGGLFQGAEKAGLTKVDQLHSKRVFSTFPILARQKKTAAGSNFTISVSCHHFGWAFPSGGKSGVDKGRLIALKTRFFNFPHRGEAKKQPWDRILQFRFHATILGKLFQAAEKAGLTKVVQLRSKRVLSTFPILARQKKTAVGSNFKISVSCHHFGWAFPSSAKRWGNEGRRIPFKTRFFNFSHWGETKKQPWDRILQFRFHATILGGLFQAAEKAGFTKVVQLRSKRVLLNFPIGGKGKNTLGLEF